MKASKQMTECLGIPAGIQGSVQASEHTLSLVIKDFKLVEGVIKEIKAQAKTMLPELIARMRVVDLTGAMPITVYKHKAKGSIKWDLEIGYRRNSFKLELELHYNLRRAAEDRIAITQRLSRAADDERLLGSLLQGELVIEVKLLDAKDQLKKWGTNKHTDENAYQVLKKLRKQSPMDADQLLTQRIVLQCHKLFSFHELKQGNDVFYDEIGSSVMNAFRTNKNQWALLNFIYQLDHAYRQGFRENSSSREGNISERAELARQALRETPINDRQREGLVKLFGAPAMSWNSCYELATHLNESESSRLEYKSEQGIGYTAGLVGLANSLKKLVIDGLSRHRFYGLDGMKLIRDRLSNETSLESRALSKLLWSIVWNSNLSALSMSPDYLSTAVQAPGTPFTWTYDKFLNPPALSKLIYNSMLNCGPFIKKDRAAGLMLMYQACHASELNWPKLHLLQAYSSKEARVSGYLNGLEFVVEGDAWAMDSNWNKPRTTLERRRIIYSVLLHGGSRVQQNGSTDDNTDNKSDDRISERVEELDSFFNEGLLDAMFMRSSEFTDAIHLLNELTCSMRVREQELYMMDDPRSKGDIPINDLTMADQQELSQDYLDNTVSYIIDHLDGLVEWYYAYRRYSELYLSASKSSRSRHGGSDGDYHSKLFEIKQLLTGTLDVFLDITSRLIRRYDELDEGFDSDENDQRISRLLDFPRAYIGIDAPIVYQLARSRLLMNHIYDQYLTIGKKGNPGKRRMYFARVLRELDDFLISINVEIDQLDLIKRDEASILDPERL